MRNAVFLEGRVDGLVKIYYSLNPVGASFVFENKQSAEKANDLARRSMGPCNLIDLKETGNPSNLKLSSPYKAITYCSAMGSRNSPADAERVILCAVKAMRSLTITSRSIIPLEQIKAVKI
ncbi:MAG: hypothetical protein V4487_06795 [Chlamydiota bacterium]